MRKWIIKLLGPLWLIFLVDLVLYFGLNSSVGPRLVMRMVAGQGMSDAYKTDAVRISPFLQHFCVKNLECSGADGLALRARSLCGKINMLGILAFRGGICMDSLKANGLQVNLNRPEAVRKCFSGLGKKDGAGVRTQVNSMVLSNGAINVDLYEGTAQLSHLMVTGGFSTGPLILHGQVAGKYTLDTLPGMEKVFGHSGKFMVEGLSYKGAVLSTDNFSVGDRVNGRFKGTLPLGKGPMELILFKAGTPELEANGSFFRDLQIRGLFGSISTVKGELVIKDFSAGVMRMGAGFRLDDLQGTLSLSATLLTGLELDRMEIRSHQMNAVLSGSSESVIDASTLKLNVVVWNARGEFLIRNKLYTGARAGHLYSGIGTVMARLRPFKLESSQIHWVAQWSSIF